MTRFGGAWVLWPAKRWIAGVVLAGAAIVALAPIRHAHAQPACPPQARPPTADEIAAYRSRPVDRGFLWRISKGGHSSYLYGTIHVGRPAWAFFGPTIGQALRSSDTLALEIDLTDPEVMRELGAGALAAGGASSIATLPPDTRERLSAHLAAACLPPQAVSMMAAQHPVMQAITLTVLAARWDGLDPSWAQELALGGAARALGKRVISLESVALQQRALLSASEMPVADQVSQMLDQLDDQRARAVLRRLSDDWERGQLDDLANYDVWCDCMNDPADRAAMRHLLDDRNPGLVEGIDAEHSLGRRVFAAVGALHMTGRQSIPELLTRRGYDVQRIAFPPATTSPP